MNLLQEITSTIEELHSLLLQSESNTSTAKSIKNETEQESKAWNDTSKDTCNDQNVNNRWEYNNLLSSVADYIEGAQVEHYSEAHELESNSNNNNDNNNNDNVAIMTVSNENNENLFRNIQDALSSSTNNETEELTLQDMMRRKGQQRAGNILVNILRKPIGK